MITILPNLTRMGLFLVIAYAFASVTAAQTTGGQRLMARAGRVLADHTAVSARIRYRTDLFDQQLVGSGNYLQQRAGNDIFLRLELRIQAGDEVTRLQQVCDGRFLWLRRDLLQDSSLTRIDLQQVRTAIAEQGDIPSALVFRQLLSLGGLPGLMDQLEVHFRFAEPRPVELYGISMWLVSGTWSQEPRGQIATGQGDRTDGLPKHVPDEVLVLLGQDDLFPYRIEYRKSETPAIAGSSATEAARSIVTMELFEVQIGMEIDPLNFVFQPGDIQVEDRTASLIEQLGLGSDSEDGM